MPKLQLTDQLMLNEACPIQLHDMDIHDDELMDVWRAHYEKLANEEFPWDKDTLTSADATAGPCEKITMDEVRAAIKKMKNNKAVGPSGVSVVVDMLKAAGDAGTILVTDM
jgi:hypothetical protein